MEGDGERVHSVVLTESEVREKMMKEIDQISEVFSVSKSDATIILIRLRWNSFQASDRLGDDKEKFLAEIGLVQFSDESNSCFASPEHCDGNGDYLVSTPFCSHNFCITCWRDYLAESLEKKEEERLVLCCPDKDCFAVVGPDTIEKLPEPLKEIYERYVLGSFMEAKKESIKLCPAPGCGYAIEYVNDDDDDEFNRFGVVCLCGHIFCWRCQKESHRPLTCNNASLWCDYLLDQSRSVAWINANAKRCPNCFTAVQREEDSVYRFITCICSCTFCWTCLRSEEEHNGDWNCAQVFAQPPKVDSSSHLSLWEGCHEAMEDAKSDLKAIEENTIPELIKDFCLSNQDIRALREAWMVIVQCRQVLKWSCAFGYFVSEHQSAKAEVLSVLREGATTSILKTRETLRALTREAMSSRDFTFFQHKLSTITTDIGKTFHDFANNLEAGLPEVKVAVYDDAPIGHWNCDRCTFENSWLDNECKMCSFPPPSPPPTPPHVAFGDPSANNP